MRGFAMLGALVACLLFATSAQAVCGVGGARVVVGGARAFVPIQTFGVPVTTVDVGSVGVVSGARFFGSPFVGVNTIGARSFVVPQTVIARSAFVPNVAVAAPGVDVAVGRGFRSFGGVRAVAPFGTRVDVVQKRGFGILPRNRVRTRVIVR